MGLHSATLHVISVFVTLTAAGVSLLTWYLHRESIGLRGWAIALLLSTLGTVLLSVRGPATPFAHVAAADVLFVAGFATMWMSMRRFNDGRMAPLRTAMVVAAICSVFLALFTFAWHVGAAVRAHSIVFSLVVGGLALLTAWETWRGGRRDGLRSRRIAAAALIGIALARLVRVAMLGLMVAGMVDPQAVAVVQGYGLYMTTVCILAVTVGLVLMANERHYAGQPDPG